MAGSHDVVERVVPLVEDAGGIGPPEDVTAAIRPWHSDVLTDRERDGATAAMDLVGELYAGGRCPDDQHPTVWQTVGVAIRLRWNGCDSLGQPGGDRGDNSQTAGAGGDHHCPAPPQAA